MARPYPPREILAILISSQGTLPDPRLDEVLDWLQRCWRAIGRAKYPALGEELDDAVQKGLEKLFRPGVLTSFSDPDHVDVWVNGIFINAAIDLLRQRGRATRRRVWLGGPDEDSEEVLREKLAAVEPSPEDMAALRQSLRAVREAAERHEVPRLRFLEDLTEREIMA